MEDFDQYMNEYLVKWRLNHFQNQEEGTQKRKDKTMDPARKFMGRRIVAWHSNR